MKAIERTIVLDDATRSKRQRKALDALEKDNFQDELPAKNLHVSDFRVQLNKKFQQRFTIQEDGLADAKETTVGSFSGGPGASLNVSSGLLNESETGGGSSTVKKRKIKVDSRLRLKKNFATLVEEEVDFDFLFYYFTTVLLKLTFFYVN
jgi:hypothetical protein